MRRHEASAAVFTASPPPRVESTRVKRREAEEEEEEVWHQQKAAAAAVGAPASLSLPIFVPTPPVMSKLQTKVNSYTGKMRQWTSFSGGFG